MAEFNRWKLAAMTFLVCATTLVESPAQTFRTLANLSADYSESTLVQGTDGELYGTTYYGGVNSSGMVFKITPNGKLTTLYNFCAQLGCPDGVGPQAGLVLGTDGDFYGTTSFGGDYFCYSGCGTVFKIGSRNSALTTLYRFCGSSPLPCLDGVSPRAVLVQAHNGDFYGTAENGGAYFVGTVFKITPSSRLKTVYNFCAQANCADGSYPFAGLVQATDGNFYGTTFFGGNGPYNGTIFRITPAGNLTTLYKFCSLPNCSDGQQPAGGLIQGTDGDLYGTTESGGAHIGAGTIFKITLSGTLTTLYSFCSQTNCNDGGQPTSGLVQATDGNLYGTTYWYGANAIYGTIYKLTPAGTLTTLHSFCDCGDGANPWAGLVQTTDGNFYGTTSGGVFGASTVFSLNVGLSPFVTFVRNYGKVGQTAGILGQGLAGTTGVAFDGVPASFRVVSDTFIQATVPLAAATGYITVTTASGTLTSNVQFRVIP